MLKDFTMLLVSKSKGNTLLKGPFALSHNEHTGQIVKGMRSFYMAVAFLTSWGKSSSWGGDGRSMCEGEGG